MADSESSEAAERVQIWKLKQLIKQLDSMKGNGTSMITLVLPPKDQLGRVSRLLTEEMGKAPNIKSRINRLSVLSAITSAQQKIKLYNKVPPNGLVIYSGTAMTAENKEKKINIDLEPFKPVSTKMYMCDDHFHTEFLTSLLTTDQTFGFIIVVGDETLYATLTGNTKKVLYKFTTDLPKKQKKGGQSAARIGRLRLEAIHNYLKKVAELSTKYFITNDKPNVAGLIVGGLAEMKHKLLEAPMFDPRLKRIVRKVVDTAYGGQNGFNQAIELSQDILTDSEYVRERLLLADYFQELAQDTGKIAYGVRDTMFALEQGAVEKLLVWETLSLIRYESITGDVYYQILPPPNIEIKRAASLTEYLAEAHRNFGAALEFITDNTSEGLQFCKGFGGIGGMLRYAVEFPDLPENGEIEGAASDESDEEWF